MNIAKTLCAILVMVMMTSLTYAQTTSNMYVITLNGQEVTVDGDLSDWADAQFFFMSQDMPHGITSIPMQITTNSFLVLTTSVATSR